ncbi:MAG: hypothetical protein WCF57_08525 [Pyrinomonadaceae bacterium]
MPTENSDNQKDQAGTAKGGGNVESKGATQPSGAEGSRGGGNVEAKGPSKEEAHAEKTGSTT